MQVKEIFMGYLWLILRTGWDFMQRNAQWIRKEVGMLIGGDRNAWWLLHPIWIMSRECEDELQENRPEK